MKINTNKKINAAKKMFCFKKMSENDKLFKKSSKGGE